MRTISAELIGASRAPAPNELLLTLRRAGILEIYWSPDGFWVPHFHWWHPGAWIVLGTVQVYVAAIAIKNEGLSRQDWWIPRSQRRLSYGQYLQRMRDTLDQGS